MRPVKPHRTRRPVLPLIVSLAVIVGSCGSGVAPAWTFPPASPAAPSGQPPSADPSSPVASGAPSTPPGEADYEFVRTAPCPDDSRFECITLAVPRDPFADGGPTWEITYAIQRAAAERLGTFVVITGGPGSSGISVADSYTDYYAAGITDHYDIVFIDQRGIGLSGAIQCPDATAVYYAGTDRPADPTQREAVGAASQAYVSDCIAEAGIDPADLPYYSTRHAVEDLEAIRDHLGAVQLHLYGESYGTQYVQYYAAAHPDRIAALYLDGPVDLTMDGLPYYEEAARSADDTLVETLNACSADESCAADVEGGDLLAIYDALNERLRGGPIEFEYRTATGEAERRELTVADLENAAFGYIFSPGDRLVLQRVLAAASNGNYVPLARAAYDSIGVEPDTLEAEIDPTWSDALYYAVECVDYAFYPDGGDPAARLARWLDGGAAAGVNELRLGITYYGDLPCLYWPAQPAQAGRPPPILDPPYPTFVLTSNTDPATPIDNAMRIYGRLDDAYFIVTRGGPHVIFAWGEPCPDDLIAAWLADGTPPPTRVTVCDGEVAYPYVPIAAPAAGDYEDALELMATMDGVILNTNDYWARVGDETYPMGCDFGGTLTYEPTDTGMDLVLDGCAFTPHLPLTGSGEIDDEGRAASLRARRRRQPERQRDVPGRAGSPGPGRLRPGHPG
jgi:pimeloyl-ACP methyl ester carboxylesterase